MRFDRENHWRLQHASHPHAFAFALRVELGLPFPRNLALTEPGLPGEGRVDEARCDRTRHNFALPTVTGVDSNPGPVTICP